MRQALYFSLSINVGEFILETIAFDGKFVDD